MLLITSQAPNPYRVKVFLQEKGIELPIEPINIMEGESRTPAFLSKNSLGEVPVLELDDGSHLTESIAICRLVESQHPEPPLFGASPLEAAQIEM